MTPPGDGQRTFGIAVPHEWTSFAALSFGAPSRNMSGTQIMIDFRITSGTTVYSKRLVVIRIGLRFTK